MNRLTDITIKSLLSSGFAMALAFFSMFSSAAKANDWGYELPNSGIDSFTSGAVTTLMKVKLSASTGAWKDNSINLHASYKGIAFKGVPDILAYKEVSKDFNVRSAYRGMDFSDAIRERTEASMEKILDKMVVDGALEFAVNW